MSKFKFDYIFLEKVEVENKELKRIKWRKILQNKSALNQPHSFIRKTFIS